DAGRGRPPLLQRSDGGVGTQLLGRRMYETMTVWETDPSFHEGDEVLADFADKSAQLHEASQAKGHARCHRQQPSTLTELRERSSQSGEELRLLSAELVLGEHALFPQRAQALELRQQVVDRAVNRRRW